MKKIELLPKGEFVINKSENEKIKGRFSMYAWSQFFEANGILTFEQQSSFFQSQMDLAQIGNMLSFALNDYERNEPKYTSVSVMDLIDEVFTDGHNDPEFIELLMHGLSRVAKFSEPEPSTIG